MSLPDLPDDGRIGQGPSCGWPAASSQLGIGGMPILAHVCRPEQQMMVLL